MTRTRKLLIGGLAVAVLGAGAFAASAHRGEWGRHGGGHHGGFGGGRMGMMGPMMGAVCSGNAAEATDLMFVKLAYKVNPTDAQKPAFEELKSAAKAAAVKAKAGCPAEPAKSADGTQPPRKSAPERLAMLEAGLSAQLDAVKTVRPVAEKFYATLSDDQKKALDAGGRGGRGWGAMGDRGPRGERGERGEGAKPDPK
jgi:hypothetical protein